MPKTSSSMPQNLTRMNPGAAAIDIRSTMHMAAVNPDCAEIPIRSFGTFTPDLYDLAAWFRSCGVTSVAMESTGVYWIPAYEILEQHGFEVILVNARNAKNVHSGRRTSATRRGFASCIPMACCAGAFGRTHRSQRCVLTCASENGWSNMRRLISSICKRL